MILAYKKCKPKISDVSFIAPGCHVIGQASIAHKASVWFGAIVRADLMPIKIGAGSNIQDNAVIHVDHDRGCIIGNDVTVGHQATIHACTIGDGTLVGIGARVLSGAKVGKHCLIAAGAVVLEDMVIEDYAVVMGVPAKIRRFLSKTEAIKQIAHAKRYWQYALQYKKLLG